MPAVNGYTTLATLKARLDKTDAGQDAVLEDVIEAASRAIDGFTNRRFHRVSETRYYTATDGDLLFVDDLGAVTTLKTDDDGDRVYEETWATTDFDLEPFNASLDGGPFTRIRITPNGTKSFPTIRKGVELVATFGYSATAPDAVAEACLIQSIRLVKRPAAPFGIESVPDLGVFQRLSRLDPDVETMIAPFRRMIVGSV